jgi:hypothetical protein
VSFNIVVMRFMRFLSNENLRVHGTDSRFDILVVPGFFCIERISSSETFV